MSGDGSTMAISASSEGSEATGVTGRTGTTDRSMRRARPTCSCGTPAPGRSRPTSRRPTRARTTSSGGRLRGRDGDTWWSAPWARRAPQPASAAIERRRIRGRRRLRLRPERHDVDAAGLRRGVEHRGPARAIWPAATGSGSAASLAFAGDGSTLAVGAVSGGRRGAAGRRGRERGVGACCRHSPRERADQRHISTAGACRNLDVGQVRDMLRFCRHAQLGRRHADHSRAFWIK